MLLMRFRLNHNWFYLASNLLDRKRKSAIRIDINILHSSCFSLRSSLSDLTLYVYRRMFIFFDGIVSILLTYNV